MEGDPLLRYFYKMRSETLKLGGPDIASSTHIAYLNTADLEPLMAAPPAGAESFFIGDNRGGSGWLVRLPDGSIEKHYVTLPPAVGVHTALLLPNPPTEHLGVPITEASAAVLARMYFRYIENLVAEAAVEFADLR